MPHVVVPSILNTPCMAQAMNPLSHTTQVCYPSDAIIGVMRLYKPGVRHSLSLVVMRDQNPLSAVVHFHSLVINTVTSNTVLCLYLLLTLVDRGIINVDTRQSLLLPKLHQSVFSSPSTCQLFLIARLTMGMSSQFPLIRRLQRSINLHPSFGDCRPWSAI